jgi:hypothetical protein
MSVDNIVVKCTRFVSRLVHILSMHAVYKVDAQIKHLTLRGCHKTSTREWDSDDLLKLAIACADTGCVAVE